MDGDDVYCDRKETHERKTFKLDELVAVAEFGEPLYPYLKPMGEVCNAPDSELWHTLIEADNYHALQLLEYLYAGKVDCIYIDSPYNTGARDWKYNKGLRPTTQWSIQSHDAYRQGTNVIAAMLGRGRFNFPKSIYAVRDCIGLFVSDKEDAFVVQVLNGNSKKVSETDDGFYA